MSVGLPFVWQDKFWRYGESLAILRVGEFVRISNFLIGTRINEIEDKLDT
jgi:hypothetical protein